MLRISQELVLQLHCSLVYSYWHYKSSQFNRCSTVHAVPLFCGMHDFHFYLLFFSPHLSWRDIQYLVVYTSQSSSLVDGDFVTNGAGLRVSSKFGFGAINAEALITRARYWSPVMNDINSTVTIVDTNG